MLAVCGPVDGHGRAMCMSQTINNGAGWRFSAAEVAAALGGVPTTLLNDFVTVGHALASVPPGDVHALYLPADYDAAAAAAQPVVCLGPGTGLGVVYTMPSGAGRTVWPSEACMAPFLCRTAEDRALCDWLAAEGIDACPTPDLIVSGEGLALWYKFLRATRAEPLTAAEAEVDTLVQQAAGLEAAVITAQQSVSALCAAAVDHFLRTLGHEAGAMGLRLLARGGVYIAGGGIAPKLFDVLGDGRVARAYLDMGRATDIVAGLPLFVVKTPDLGMRGVAALARQQLVPI